ncbi:MAG: hypothetical protein WD740_01515 [Anaerolineales bacterium]
MCLAKSNKGGIFLLIVTLVSSLGLAACDGSAVIDINFDATEGVGNIIVSGDQEQPAETQNQNDGSLNTTQILLFGLIVALLFGTVAIVIALARRPRPTSGGQDGS